MAVCTHTSHTYAYYTYIYIYIYQIFWCTCLYAYTHFFYTYTHFYIDAPTCVYCLANGCRLEDKLMASYGKTSLDSAVLGLDNCDVEYHRAFFVYSIVRFMGCGLGLRTYFVPGLDEKLKDAHNLCSFKVKREGSRYMRNSDANLAGMSLVSW